jgi:hypothetical protein
MLPAVIAASRAASADCTQEKTSTAKQDANQQNTYWKT